MANQMHLELFRTSVAVWNAWRGEHPEIQPDLSGGILSFDHSIQTYSNTANLSGVNLSRSNLDFANLGLATYIEADLRDVQGSGAYLSRSNFSRAFFSRSNLRGADLTGANLSGADLNGANLENATLIATDFDGADLSGAKLTMADLRFANLNCAHLDRAIISTTQFGDRDFRSIKGLETVQHQGPSPLSINSLYLSRGEIPEIFVRGTGAPEAFIEYMRSLIVRPIEYYTCFLSYSGKDQEFAKRLYTDLQANGVRCWFAPEDLKIGDHYHQRIDESIRLSEKLILILSASAVQSAWVEREVVSAREKEDREQRPVLFPIRLDDAVMDTTKVWAADIRRRWHIGDFTQWKDYDAYQQGLERLLHDLKSGEKS